MQAARLVKVGKVKAVEVPIPKAQGKQDVVVRVHAVGLNPVDWKLRDYNFFGSELPYTLGYDFAGVVTAVGEDVKGIEVGDEVYGQNSLVGDGCFAEYVRTTSYRVAPKPSSLSMAEAASVPVAALSAYLCLVTTGKIKKGESVFVSGGSGGVGMYAVQLAVAAGCKVITTAGSHLGFCVEKLGLPKESVIDYRGKSTEDIVKAVKGATDGKGADVVLELAGTTTDVTTQAVAAGGRWINLSGDKLDVKSAGKQALEKAGATELIASLGHASSAQEDPKVIKPLVADTLRILTGMFDSGEKGEEKSSAALQAHLGEANYYGGGGSSGVVKIADLVDAIELIKKGKKVPGKMAATIVENKK